ncbi:unnamed protein product, partial [Brassica rapa subsp. narinosa]
MRARCFWSACRSFLFDGGSCKSVLGGGGELSMAPANPEFRCILFVFFSSHDIAVYLSGCFRREVPTSSRLSMAGSCLRYVSRLTGLEDNMLWSSTSQRNSLSFGSSCGCVSNCFICSTEKERERAEMLQGVGLSCGDRKLLFYQFYHRGARGFRCTSF